MRNGKKRIGPIAAALIVGVAAVSAALYFQPYPVSSDTGLLESSASVRVERSPLGLAFLPAGRGKRVGLIFYSGARVSPESFAYLARACAEVGFATVLPSSPLNFATIEPDKAEQAASAYPSIERWAVGGHALGGAVACSYAADHPVAGLFLLAAYPGKGADLSSSVMPAISLSASNDGIATPAEIARSRSRMPSKTRYVELTGGNHAQFGEYGPQKGDGLAEISGQAQRGAVVEEAVAFLEGVEAQAGK